MAKTLILTVFELFAFTNMVLVPLDPGRKTSGLPLGSAVSK